MKNVSKERKLIQLSAIILQRHMHTADFPHCASVLQGKILAFLDIIGKLHVSVSFGASGKVPVGVPTNNPLITPLS